MKKNKTTSVTTLCKLKSKTKSNKVKSVIFFLYVFKVQRILFSTVSYSVWSQPEIFSSASGTEVSAATVTWTVFQKDLCAFFSVSEYVLTYFQDSDVPNLLKITENLWDT